MSSFDVPTLEFLIAQVRKEKPLTDKRFEWLRRLEAQLAQKTKKK